MKVKIGDTWYSSERRLLAVQFSREELQFIKEQMPLDEGNRKFGSGPSEDESEFLAWIRDEIPEPKPEWHEDKI